MSLSRLQENLSHLNDQADLTVSRELFIQFSRQYEEKDLKRVLTERFGPVESVEFNYEKLYAFVRFVSLQDALIAKENLPGSCKKVDFSQRRVHEGGGFYATLDMTGSKILIGFICDNAIYCKNIVLMPVNYGASVEFNGNRRLLQVFYGPYKYEFQWSHIKNIYWSEEESRLSIEWDYQIGGPKIISTSRNVRTTENPLGLNEVDRNAISFIVNESEYKRHVKKIQGAFPIVTGRMKLAPVPPRDFVFPADIPLATGFLIERLLSMFIPKEVIDNNFWEVVRSTPTILLHAALTNIYETSNSLVISPVTELKEQIAKAEKRMSNSKSVPADADVVPRDSVKMFYLDITPTKHYFHGPLIEKSNRVLRKYKDHPYNFIRVTFVEEDGTKLHNISNPLLEHFKQIMTKGVKLAGRHFKFLSWSNSQLKSHSCFFFASISRPQNEVSCISIIQDLGKFKDGSPAKCAARIAQCFSTTSSGIPLTEDQYSFISDVQRNQYTFSDGIGKISPMLAKQVAKKHHLKPMPSAYQIRFKGCKGMVVVDPKLDGSKVELRRSMDKFISQDNELEINKHSTYHAAYLNRQIITLLLSLGADPKGFEALEAKMVAEIDAMFELNSETKEKVAMLNSFTSGYSGSLLKRITDFGFDDAFVRALINVHCRKALNMLIEKTKIHVPKGAFLYGVLDEYGVLEEDEIFLQIRDTNTYAKEVIEGLAIVTRSPCLHPGDIRHVKAVNKPELLHLENVVVFSQKGSRPITDMMAGGDLDGDFFTVLWDESIFPPRIAQPMSYVQSRQAVISSRVLYPTDFIDFFIQHMANDTLGRIANLWLAHAERNKGEAAFSSACLTLAGLHSDAVDYAKTGIPVRLPEGLILKQFPDYMEKPDKDSFKSTTFIGESYRRIKQKFGSKREEPNVSLVADPDLVAYPGYNEYLNEAYKIMKAYNRQIDQLKRIYGTFSEVEIVSGIILRSKKARNRRQNNAIENLASNYAVIRSEFVALFKQGTEKDKKSKLAKASAWYRAVYMPSENYKGKRKQYASFAWLVDKYLIKIKQEAVQRRKMLELKIKDTNNDSGPSMATGVTTNSIQSTPATRTALPSNNTNVQPSTRNIDNRALSYRAKPQESLAVNPTAGKVQSTAQQPKYVVFGRNNNKN